MAKNKKSKRKSPDPSDMIHFRPGADLGKLIGELADELELSRGEVSKRMTALAIRGLDLSCYGLVDELSNYLYRGVAASFDEAAHYAYVTASETASKSKCEVYEMTRDEIHESIKTVLGLHKRLHEHDENAEKKRVRIRIQITD